MKLHHSANEKVSATFQAVAFLATFLVLALFFSVRYHLFMPHDPHIALIPFENAENSVIVGLHINHFTEFNITQNKFTFDGIIWFLFNPDIVSLSAIKKFDIFNGSILHVSDPMVMPHESNKQIAQFRIRAEFQTPLSYRLFPLDDHKLNIVFYNHYLPKEVTLFSENSDITFSPPTFLSGWNIINHSVKTGTKNIPLGRTTTFIYDTQKEVIITLDCERSDPGLIINIILTLILMLFLAQLTFSSDEDSVLIVTVGIVALIGYRGVMHAIAPPQVSYFILSDYLYLYALTGVVITLFGGIITQHHGINKVTFKKWYISGVYLFFVGACIITTVLLS